MVQSKELGPTRSSLSFDAAGNTTATPPQIHRRHLPTCGPISSSKFSTRVEVGEVSKRFTRDELEDACRRNKAKDIAAMTASRKRNAIAVQNQRVTQSGADPVDTSSGQMRLLDVGVKLCARKCNDAKAQADRLEEAVKTQNHELFELNREANALHEMLDGNHEDMRKIASLEAEIHDADSCSEAMLLYRHQLNHMHQRLGNDSVSLDGQLGEISAALSTAEKERVCSQKMLADLESSLVCASIELDETIRDTRVVEEERKHDLAMKQQDATSAGRMEEWNKARLRSNLALNASLADANRSERERLQRTIRERQSQLKDLRKSLGEHAAKLMSLEESFMNIEEGTGVNSIAAMVLKMTYHEEHHLRLMQEKKDAEERLKAAKASLSNDQEELDRFKTKGIGSTELNREILDDIKGSIASEKKGGKITKSTNERIEILLVGLRNGGIGLYNRLLPFHSTLLDGEAPNLGDLISTNAIQTASDTMEMISFTEKILGKMLTEIGGIRFVEPKAGRGKEDDFASPTNVINCRVAPKVRWSCAFMYIFRRSLTDTVGAKPATQVEYDAEDDDEDATVDSTDDVPSRNRLKMKSEIHVDTRKQETRKKRVKQQQSPSQKEIEFDDTIQTASDPAEDLAWEELTTPSKSRPKRPDPMDGMRVFLTELPPEGDN